MKRPGASSSFSIGASAPSRISSRKSLQPENEERLAGQSRNFRPRSKNEIPRKSAHDCSLKEKRDHPPRMMMPSWETCEGDRLLGLQPTWRRAAILGISLLSRQDRPAVDAASSRGCPIFDALAGPREA